MGYSIQELSEENAGDWDEFNNRCPEGTFYHTVKWKNLLENTLNIDLKYWIIWKGQKMVGILPFMNRPLVFLKGLEPIPHSEFNNILLKDDLDLRDLDKVLTLFASKYSFLSLNMDSKLLWDHMGYNHHSSENTGNMVLDLRQNPPDKIWEDFTARKGQRRFIRRFGEKGFWIREIHEQEDMKTFYRYYAENLARINGDILPLAFFQSLLEAYSQDEMRVTLLSKEDICAGGLLTFVHPASKTVYFEYLSLNRGLPNTYHPTYPLFWEGLNWAWDNGYQKVSFGRQRFDPKSARFQIKAGFGAKYVPIYSNIVLFSRTASILYRFKRIYRGRSASAG